MHALNGIGVWWVGIGRLVEVAPVELVIGAPGLQVTLVFQVQRATWVEHWLKGGSSGLGQLQRGSSSNNFPKSFNHCLPELGLVVSDHDEGVMDWQTDNVLA